MRTAYLLSLALVAGSVVLAAPLVAPDAPDTTRPDAAVSGIEGGEWIVDLADSIDVDERNAVLAALPGDEHLNSPFSVEEGLYIAQLDAATAREWVPRLRRDARIEAIEPNAVVTLDETAIAFDAPEVQRGRVDVRPNDPLYDFQWHLEQIGVEGAWRSSRGDDVVVAVIDTGVAYRTVSNGRFVQAPDLALTTMVAGWDFVSGDDTPDDEHGHGTHVAGTIAQSTNNGYGVAGVAPRASIMPIRVLDQNGRGHTANIAESIRWAADHGADIINMSLGGPLPSRVMFDAITYARSRGVTVIAAAGNSGVSVPSFPAGYPGVIGVAATQFDRTTTFYSNYGIAVDVAAPGGNTRVDQNRDGRPDGVLQETIVRQDPTSHEFALYMGTSMAAPHVAGVAALVHAAGVTHPARVEKVLEQSATRDVPAYSRERFGAGLVSAEQAVATAIRGTSGSWSLLGPGLLWLALGAAGARRRTLSVATASLAATFAAGGLALVALIAAQLGAQTSLVASFSVAPLVMGAAWLGPLALSALPVLSLYAVAGHARGTIATGAVVGSMAGMAATLLGVAMVAPVDIGWIAGSGLLDRAWAASNAVIAFAATAAAVRGR